jgi:hypothetical protein
MKWTLKNLGFSRYTWIGTAVVAVALVCWIGLLIGGVFEPKKLGVKQVDPNRCPHCNHALTAYAKQTGECLFCRGELPGKEKASVVGSKVIPGVLIGLFVILLTINIVLFVRSITRGNVEEVYYQTQCRKCGRKVRFREHQCGQLAKCPICRQVMRFPVAPEKPPGPWTRMKGWFSASRRKKVNQEMDEHSMER